MYLVLVVLSIIVMSYVITSTLSPTPWHVLIEEDPSVHCMLLAPVVAVALAFIMMQ